MDSDCSDEDMSSSVNEVSAILSRIRDFDVSNVDNEIDNLIHFDKCLEISENLDKFIEDINQFNLTNVDYLNKKALILELALKCSKRLNVLNHHELQQHLNHKDHELHLLKERLTAIENKLITASEIQPINPTPKTNKIKRNQISPLKQQGKKSKINESIITPAPLELKNKFMSLEVEEFPSLTNNNEDVSQTMESNSNQETNSDNEEEIEPLTAEINKKRIPPIIIDESVNTPALMDEICTLLGFKIMARMSAHHRGGKRRYVMCSPNRRATVRVCGSRRNKLNGCTVPTLIPLPHHRQCKGRCLCETDAATAPLLPCATGDEPTRLATMMDAQETERVPAEPLPVREGEHCQMKVENW
ncbi:hypothetical protein NPIL_481931 [Nephila pilipes]|uniref:Uncharacterized protein n=1 Tax=Nephila pilipes TaxID=299642 RepID=A0A8X6U0N8_NEPPI|nr:hypothetical protein NPIL_481931 [Nephila pilipes]